jgi:hypothetical protein
VVEVHEKTYAEALADAVHSGVVAAVVGSAWCGTDFAAEEVTCAGWAAEGFAAEAVEEATQNDGALVAPEFEEGNSEVGKISVGHPCTVASGGYVLAVGDTGIEDASQASYCCGFGDCRWPAVA